MSPGDKRYRDPEWLREQAAAGLSQREIGAKCGVSGPTISEWMSRHDIEPNADTGAPSHSDSRPDKLDDPDWLREKYQHEEMSMGEIGRELDTSASSIQRALEQHGISTRQQTNNKAGKYVRDASWLRKKYCEERLSANEIAQLDKVNISQEGVTRWLHRHNIELRHQTRDHDGRVENHDWLRRQYVERSRSMMEIAADCGCTSGKVLIELNKAGVETRDASPHAVKCEEFSITFSSGLEHAAAHFWEDHGGGWKYESLRFECSTGEYTPDFVLDESALVECKGRVDFGDGATQARKLAELKQQGWIIILIAKPAAKNELPHDLYWPSMRLRRDGAESCDRYERQGQSGKANTGAKPDVDG